MATKLQKLVKQEHVLQLLAYQHADGTDEFTIRKSFEQYLDLDASMQAEIAELFETDFASVRAAFYQYTDVDKVYVPELLF